MKMLIASAVVTAIVSSVAIGADRNGEPDAVVGSVFTHPVVAGETMASLACRFGVSATALARLNDRGPLAPLRPGERIVIDNRHIRPTADATLVLSVAQQMLFYKEDGAVRAYPIGVGTTRQPTPLGRFTVTATDDSEADSEGSQEAPFIRLSLGIDIRGTADRTAIYGLSTDGEIRMHSTDLLDLQPRLQAGTAGISIYEPVLAASVNGRVFVEVHADPYALSRAPMGRLGSLIFALGAMDHVNWPMVEDAFTRKDGIAIDVTTAAHGRALPGE